MQPEKFYGAGAFAIGLILTLILAAYLTPRAWWKRPNARALLILVVGARRCSLPAAGGSRTTGHRRPAGQRADRRPALPGALLPEPARLGRHACAAHRRGADRRHRHADRRARRRLVADQDRRRRRGKHRLGQQPVAAPERRMNATRLSAGPARAISAMLWPFSAKTSSPMPATTISLSDTLAFGPGLD